MIKVLAKDFNQKFNKMNYSNNKFKMKRINKSLKKKLKKINKKKILNNMQMKV